MKRLIQMTMIMGMFLLLAGMQLWFQAPLGVQAQADGCSLATLNGTYIYSYDGVSITDEGQTPYAYAGQENYNGDGTMTGTFSGSLGSNVTRFGTYDGTYTLEANCRGTLITVASDGLTLSFDIFVDPGTGDFFFAAIDAGEVNQGLNRKAQ